MAPSPTYDQVKNKRDREVWRKHMQQILFWGHSPGKFSVLNTLTFHLGYFGIVAS